MLYREIGRTGKRASVVGLGCEHLDGKPYAQVQETVDAALAGGINILDVFMPGQPVREHIAKALGGRRSQVMIQGHIGSTDLNQQYDISRDMPVVRRYFDDLLRCFDGYIDFGMLFFMDSEADFQGVFETPFADYVQTLKAQGKLGHIGFSSHNPAIATRVIETGLPEMMMFSINLAFDLCPPDVNVLDTLKEPADAARFRGLDPVRAALYALCAQRGVGITVMKTLGAGILLSAEHSPFAAPMTVAQCIHYVLTRPAVASALVGCKTAEEVEGVLRYVTAEDAERDYAPLLGAMRDDFHGRCVYCSHCQPCPAGIDIAAVNKYLDIARLDAAQVPPTLRAHYAALPQGGDACIACGSCQARCPFGVPIIDRMAEAARVLG